MATKKEAAATAAVKTPPAPPAGQEPPPDEPAAPKKAKAKVVELADKDTGFYDPVTGFQIVRDQKAKLEGTIGTATQTALQSGRLLEVED